MDTLFGAPVVFDTHTLWVWREALERLWLGFANQAPGELPDDLARAERVFGAGASPKVLRASLDGLDPDLRFDFLPPQVAFDISGVQLITPEGRLLLEVLGAATPFGGTSWSIEPASREWALSQAVDLRSRWYRAWAERQVDGTLSAPVLGAAVFLLINRSIGPKSPLPLPHENASPSEVELSRVVIRLISDFSIDLGGKAPEFKGGLQRHWVFSQLSRYLGRYVVRQTSRHGGNVYVRLDAEGELVEELRERLSRFAPDRVHAAVFGMAREYRSHRGQLLAAGVGREDPARTSRLVAALTEPSRG
jgi:hypothetical protein